MAKILDKSTIVSLGVVRPGHVSQSVDAFTGIEAYDITISGSLTVTGSTNISGSVEADAFSGSFSGSGADLYGIPASAIVGLNLSQISSGSVSASISPDDGLQVNTSVTATSFTGSFSGTSSYADAATSASYSVSSSYADNTISASYALSASYSPEAISSSYADNATSASYAVSSSYALETTSASYADNAISSSYTDTATSASYSLSSSYSDTATSSSYADTATSASYADNATSASYTLSSSYTDTATSASYSTSSSYADIATSASYADTSISASYSSNATSASHADVAITASYSDNSTSASYALSSTSASYALTASFANFATSASYASSSTVSERTLQTDILVLNQSGYTITKGMVVRITGSGTSSDIPRVVSASYENDNMSANTLGIATANITNGSQGFIITEGVLLGIDTSNYISGQLVYLGPTGSITGSAPQAPLHTVRLGQIIREQSNNGSMHVRIDNGTELGELHDVRDTTTTGSYGDLLVKSGSVWINSKQLTGSYGLTGSLTATSFIGNLTGSAQSAISSSHALTASYVDTLNQNVLITGSLTVLQGATIYGSSSFQYITSSQLAVSASFISVNVFEPLERFGGLKVYDSGSSSATASLAWDSLHNHWVYQNASGSTYTGGMLLSGPRNTGSLGDEPNLTTYYVPRSDGGDHLDNSQIYSSASVTIVTGSLTVTSGVTASLQGTASYASQALSASYALTATSTPSATSASYAVNATSASYALTASYVLNAVSSSYSNNSTSASYALSSTSASYALTSSYVLNSISSSFASTASYVNPLIQDVLITGSLILSASGTTNDFRVGTNKIFVSSSGNVGIGTTTPSTKLHVSHSSAEIARFESPSTTGNAYVSFYGNGVAKGYVGYGSPSNNGLFLTNYLSDAGASLSLGTNGTARLYISSSGNVGIGITTPSATLHINNTGESNSFLVEDSTNPDLTPFIITNNGNVGIGNTIPNGKLDVNGNTVITGSLNVTAGITGSLFGTASWAQNTTSASYTNNATSASYALTASYFSGSIENATSASYALTASYFSGSIENATSASYALTASFVKNSQTASYVDPLNQNVSIAGNTIITGSIATYYDTGFGYIPVIDGINGSLYGLDDSLPTQRLDWVNRVLYGASGFNSVTSLHWGNRNMFDSNTTQSINWNDRTLHNPAGTTILNWNNGITITGSMTVSGSLVLSGSLASPTGDSISSDALVQAALLYFSNNF